MTHYITQIGIDKLNAEIKELKEVKLPDVLDALSRARSEGDLRENAAYDTSKAEQEKIQNRMSEIEEILSDYIFVEEDKESGSSIVRIGGKVEIEYLNLPDKKNFELKIVGVSEANALKDRISNESPLAHAILGKKVGDICTFKVKEKEMKVKIIKIVY